MFVFEVDEEITLKMLDIYDAERLFNIIDSSREILREWLPWLDDTTSVLDSKQFIENAFQLYAEKVALTVGIFFSNELVGIAGFNTFDWRNRIGSIGYWLGKDVQGKGIMTRSVRAFIDYGFQSLELNRIEIRAAYANYKSRAIPERLGFKQEGIIRQAEWLYDHYVDHVVYGMLANEWQDKEHS